jgi:hypothetical protein
MKVRETRILTVLGDDAVRTGDREAAVKWLQEAANVGKAIRIVSDRSGCWKQAGVSTE